MLIGQSVREPLGSIRTRLLSTLASYMMISSSLLQILTEPLNRKARRRIKAIRNQVFNSKAVRIFLMATWEEEIESDSNIPKRSLSTRIAYALPHTRILWEDEILQQASHYTLQTLGLPLFACLYWAETAGVQVRMPLPLRRHTYQRWWETNGPPHLLKAERLLHEAEARKVSEPLNTKFEEKPFGVNLIGHAFNVFGLGEFMRMTAKALEAGGIPFCVINVPNTNGAPSTDHTLASRTLCSEDLGPYAFNLYCMTADTQVRLANARRPGSLCAALFAWLHGSGNLNVGHPAWRMP
jgi:hypothetical protein